MSVSKVYCKAFYETILPQVKKAPDFFDSIKSEIDLMDKTIASSKLLQTALLSPSTAPKEKQAIVQELGKKLELSKEFSNFLQLLAMRSRMSIISGLVDVIDEIHLEHEGGMMGDIVSAERLAPADVEGLEKAFSTKIGKKAKFREKIDPALLAGLRVTLGGVTYDGSLKAQLDRLRNQFQHWV